MRESTVLYAILLLAALATAAAAQTRMAALTCSPAPFGYACTGFNGTLYGWEPGGGACTVSGVLVAPVPPWRLYAETGVYSVRLVMYPSRSGGFVLRLGGSTIVAWWGGSLYASPHLIGRDIIVSTGRLYNSTMGKTLLFAGPDYVITVVLGNGLVVSESLAGFLGISESCIVKMSGGPWTGGLVDSPACIHGKPVATTVYEGMPVVVALRDVETRYGRLAYLVFAKPSIEALVKLGLFVRVPAARGVHVTRGEEGLHYYIYTGGGLPRPLPVYRVSDATSVERGRRLCAIPARAEVVAAILWRQSTPAPGTVAELEPGEIIVYRYGGRLYACTGSLAWLDSSAPYVSQPRYRELGGYVTITGDPVALVVSCDGRVWSGHVVRLPFSYVEKHAVWVVAGTFAARIYPTSRSILESPEMIAAAIVFLVVAIIATRRPRQPPDVVEVVWDIQRDPEPPQLARDPSDAAARHVDAWGYCPDAVELAQRYKVLPEPGARLCPLDVEPGVEELLRALGRFAAATLWALRRDTPYSAVLYAPVGGSTLYWHVYAPRPGSRPEEAVWDALVEASRQRPPPGTHPVRLGVVILAGGGDARRLAEVVERLRASSGWNVSGYLAAVVKEPARVAQALHDWVNKNIREILVATPRDLWRLVEATCPYIQGVKQPPGGAYHPGGVE